MNAGRLVATVEKFPQVLEEAKHLFQDVEVGLKERAEARRREGRMGIIHGDFWTGK